MSWFSTYYLISSLIYPTAFSFPCVREMTFSVLCGKFTISLSSVGFYL
jgi:hypothetical protein